MSVTISSTEIVLTYSAALWTFSSKSVPPQSSAPKGSAICPAWAVHHGGRRLEAAAVRFAVDLEPRLRPALLRRDAAAHARGEDLGAAPGNGPLAGVPEAVEDVREGQVGHLRHRVDLRG